MQDKELGAKIISNFYLFLILFYIFPLFIFSTRIAILGKTTSEFTTLFLNVFFISLLTVLYLTVKNLSRPGLWLGLSFHLVFIVNNVLMLFGKIAIFKIKGLEPGDHILRTPIILTSLAISIFINIGIIYYLVYSRKRFR